MVLMCGGSSRLSPTVWWEDRRAASWAWGRCSAWLPALWGSSAVSKYVEMSLCTTLRRAQQFQVTVPRALGRWEERGRVTAGKNPKEGQGSSMAADSPSFPIWGSVGPLPIPHPWLDLRGLPPKESGILGCQSNPQARPRGTETNFSPELFVVSSQSPRHLRLQHTSKGSLMNANDS